MVNIFEKRRKFRAYADIAVAIRVPVGIFQCVVRSNGVIVIDDNALLCDLLRELVEKFTTIVWLGAAYTLAGAMKLYEETKPGVVVLDIQLPDGNGWDFVEWAYELSSPPRILIMSGRIDERTLVNATHYPVAGFVNKQVVLKANWIEALNLVSDGKTFFSASIVDAIREIRNDPNSWVKILSDRERQILPLLAAGYADDVIAVWFKVQPISIKTYRRRIRVKLGLKSTVELIEWCFQKGFLLKPAPPCLFPAQHL